MDLMAELLWWAVALSFYLGLGFVLVGYLESRPRSRLFYWVGTSFVRWLFVIATWWVSIPVIYTVDLMKPRGDFAFMDEGNER